MNMGRENNQIYMVMTSFLLGLHSKVDQELLNTVVIDQHSAEYNETPMWYDESTLMSFTINLKW